MFPGFVMEKDPEKRRSATIRMGVLPALFAVLFLAGYSAFNRMPPDSLRLVYDNAASVIGMGASIEPNEYNTLAQELEKRSEDLDRREAEIRAREAALGVDGGSPIVSARVAYFFGGITLLLLTLILLNFYFDWKRNRASRSSDGTPSDPAHRQSDETKRLLALAADQALHSRDHHGEFSTRL
jgi:hypothetical protein